MALLTLAAPAAADELDIEIIGVKEPMLSNVRSRVAPFRITGTTRLSRRRLADLRQTSERRARSALRPFGYYHATVASDISNVGKRAWLLKLHIKPGPPVLVSEVALEFVGPGAELEELRLWKSGWPLTRGSTLNQATWDAQKQAALDIAENNGYLLAKFSQHRLELDLERNEASLALTLETGEQAVMGEIRFLQDGVKPHVLENLPRFKAGDPYSSWMMEKFRIDIWKTGYFRNIEIIEDRQLNESPPAVNLVIKLVPRNNDTYQGTIGIGSDTGPRLQFSWSRHRLSSNGDSFSLGAGWQEHNDEFFIRGNYRLPRNVKSREFWVAEALTTNENQDLKVSDNDFNETTFTLANSSISDYSLRLGRLKIRDRQRGFLQLFETMYMQYVRESIDYRLTIPEEDGLRTFLDPEDGDLPLQNFDNSLALGIDYDMPLITGEGFETVGFHHRAWAFTSNQAWGSDEDFTQLYAASRWNFIVGQRWKILLRGEVGYSNADVNRLAVDIEDREINLSVTDLPNIYRFKAGGSTSVRGYGFETLSNNGIGSNNIITASAEVEMRVLPKWSVAAFYDFGNAFNDWDDIELRRSPGIGIRWYTIAGAIRVDLAKGLDLPDQPWRFNFTIGISLL